MFSVEQATNICNGYIDGDWYKISIDKDGVYSIDTKDLSKLSINTQTLNPESIHMFTNPSGGRPIINSISL